MARPKKSGTTPKLAARITFGESGITLPIYTGGGCFLSFKISEVETEMRRLGWHVDSDSNALHSSFMPLGYMSASDLVICAVNQPAEIDLNIEAIVKIERACRAATTDETWDIALHLAATSEIFALGLRLNNAGFGADQRNQVLSRKFPEFKPHQDDIWHAAHAILMTIPISQRLDKMIDWLACTPGVVCVKPQLMFPEQLAA